MRRLVYQRGILQPYGYSNALQLEQLIKETFFFHGRAASMPKQLDAGEGAQLHVV